MIRIKSSIVIATSLMGLLLSPQFSLAMVGNPIPYVGEAPANAPTLQYYTQVTSSPTAAVTTSISPTTSTTSVPAAGPSTQNYSMTPAQIAPMMAASAPAAAAATFIQPIPTTMTAPATTPAVAPPATIPVVAASAATPVALGSLVRTTGTAGENLQAIDATRALTPNTVADSKPAAESINTSDSYSLTAMIEKSKSLDIQADKSTAENSQYWNFYDHSKDSYSAGLVFGGSGAGAGSGSGAVDAFPLDDGENRFGVYRKGTKSALEKGATLRSIVLFTKTENGVKVATFSSKEIVFDSNSSRSKTKTGTVTMTGISPLMSGEGFAFEVKHLVMWVNATAGELGTPNEWQKVEFENVRLYLIDDGSGKSCIQVRDSKGKQLRNFHPAE